MTTEDNLTIISQETKTECNIKFYSQRAILTATLFGTPLAASILLRRNFINLGKEELGRNTLIIGIISTILIFVGIFSIPEDIIDKIPNFLIPAIYTAIIYFTIEKYQGQELKHHKENDRPFYSIWKAIGIGTVCLLVLFAGVFGYAYLQSDDFYAKKYDNGIEEFNINEYKNGRINKTTNNKFLIINPKSPFPKANKSPLPAL